uniref:Uncharacterized protein n=1 Tax=Salix viminalis TaxID=40686 RepID=A0A6N2LMP4_SALVM
MPAAVIGNVFGATAVQYFDGSGNEIYAEEHDHNLSPKFQLKNLYLSSRGQVAKAFPKFLYHQFNLQYLDLTNIQIKGEFPSWLIENNTYLKYLSLENCSLSGPFLLPRSSHVNLSILSISMNSFQGQIPSEIGVYFPRLRVLIMSDNGFDGNIPSLLGNMSSLQLLDMSNNFLTGRTHSNNSLQGQIPGWIGNMSSLEFLDLSANNFSGLLPPRFGASSKLRQLYLSRNKLQGPITMEFHDFYEIMALDLSHNDLTGRILEWIGRLSNLRFLLLSHNNFEGEIPIQLCRLEQLTLIELSHNYLSGNILSWRISTPHFRSMMTSYDSISSSQQSFEFTTKNEIESLDLSYNKLEGEIPPQLTKLYSLEIFSVAHNNLSGKTPARVAQFATFEESCYKDNTFLCGQPLPKACDPEMPPSPTPTSTNKEDNGGFMDMEVFYVSFGVAYIMVLLVIGAVLYINPYWRRAWFHFIEVGITNCYYFMVDNLPILSKEQHIPTRSFFRKLLYFGSILIAKKFSCESIIPKFQGQIPAEIEAYLPGLQVLLMSDNGFDGRLQGQIPGWIGNMSSLEFLDLSGNNLSGPLPPRIGASSKLRYFYLSRNKLQGPIAMEFDDSYEIVGLDLSYNDLTGEIPFQLCRLEQLTLIDLSHNYLSGNILSWMISTHPFPNQNNYDYQQSLEFTMKNVSFIYKRSILWYFTGVDFSSNNFTGEIPLEIGNLSKFKVLNLSHNSCIESIPPTF